MAQAAGSARSIADGAVEATTVSSGDDDEGVGDGDRLLDGERSLLEFNARVLAMACVEAVDM